MIKNFLRIFVGLLGYPAITLAQVITLENPLEGQYETIPEFIEGILKIVVQIGVPIAVFFIIYAGFLFVTSRGSDSQLEKAKTTLTWALIGSAILLGAWVLANAVAGTVKQITG